MESATVFPPLKPGSPSLQQAPAVAPNSETHFHQEEVLATIESLVRKELYADAFELCLKADPKDPKTASSFKLIISKGKDCPELLLACMEAFQQESSITMWALGLLYLEQGNDNEAFVLIKAAHEAGDSNATNTLGWIYINGESVAHDYEEAVRLFKLAHEAGNSNATINLGTMYVKGKGVVQDYKEAVHLFKLAHEAGNFTATTNLGTMYASGKGVVQDYEEAVRLFKLAHEAGNSNATTS